MAVPAIAIAEPGTSPRRNTAVAHVGNERCRAC
jgi:hypothetical protein